MFAVMLLQFKIVGTPHWPAPSPSPLASVTDWMLLSTKQMCFVQTLMHKVTTASCKVATTFKRFVVQVGLGH